MIALNRCGFFFLMTEYIILENFKKTLASYVVWVINDKVFQRYGLHLHCLFAVALHRDSLSVNLNFLDNDYPHIILHP